MKDKRGFTLIEMLVASLLLGMLVTILTMVFNSSAIAWRTGKASISQMSLARRQLSYAQYVADNTLPRVDKTNPSQAGRVLGAWDEKGNIRQRAVEKLPAPSGLFSFPSWNRGSAGSSTPEPWAQVTVHSLPNDTGQGYIVGVWSLGPDGNRYTEDDITTWPQEVE